MVNISQIRECNKQIDDSSAPRVAVFFGGTSGIGKLTLAKIAGLGHKFRAYVIGRKETAEAFRPVIDELQQGNPHAEIIWVEGQCSLLSEIKRVCDHIKTRESAIDLLYLTAGYAPFGGRQNTPEGIDTVHSLEFYGRMCFTDNLLPLLRASGRARVISIHAGGLEYESALDINDINLEKPGAYFVTRTQFHMGVMNTLALERFSEDPLNQSIVFMHSHAGIVRTGNVYRGWKEGSWGIWFATLVIDPLMMLIGTNLEEAADKFLYQVTSGTFGGQGPKIAGIEGKNTRGEVNQNGMFLANRRSEPIMNEKEMAKLRVKAKDVVWEKLREILKPYV